MADKQALRTLQTRLAQRLQDAQAQGNHAAWLAVETRHKRYLLPLELAGEIFSPTAAMPIPHATDWFLGVIHLRGQICGVVDLSAYLGEGHLSLQLQTESVRSQARLITFNPSLGVNCALLVAKLVGLRNTQDFFEVSPAAEDDPPFLTDVYQDAQGQQWQEINLQALAESDSFLHIAI